MLPKLLALLATLLQVGQFAMETYVRVRSVLPLRKRRAYSEAERLRYNELDSIHPRVLTPEERKELADLTELRRTSQEM